MVTTFEKYYLQVNFFSTLIYSTKNFNIRINCVPTLQPGYRTVHPPNFLCIVTVIVLILVKYALYINQLDFSTYSFIWSVYSIRRYSASFLSLCNQSHKAVMVLQNTGLLSKFLWVRTSLWDTQVFCSGTLPPEINMLVGSDAGWYSKPYS